MAPNTQPTRLAQPIILVRGFGGLSVEDEKRIAYQGFNDGTVYPQKRGENYIYEGMILRFIKSKWTFRDATNVVGYYGAVAGAKPVAIPDAVTDLDPSFFSGDKVVLDPVMAAALRANKESSNKTLWVFRYYDLNDRVFETYGKALVRVIDFIRAVTKAKNAAAPKVNIIAHSMGGLLVREAIQRTYPGQSRDPSEYINKVVTLGTPHQGISFQVLSNWIGVDAEQELDHFNPTFQADKKNPKSYKNFSKHFPPERVLTVVGTNYRTYGPATASWMNRLFSVGGEFGPNYNRSDGLVKQAYAQLPGAPRTFVHKCHGGPDSLVTSREAFEVATRFFFGDVHARLHLVSAKVKRGFDLVGKSELFFGVSIKPRGVDFDLFHQSAEAENCYGPFTTDDFSDSKLAFDWAGKDRLVWEGWLDTGARIVAASPRQAEPLKGEKKPALDLVIRADFYVGERDLFGFGFSDNVIFRKQYYVRALMGKGYTFEYYTGEEYGAGKQAGTTRRTPEGWEFDIVGTGFEATLRVSFERVPEVG